MEERKSVAASRIFLREVIKKLKKILIKRELEYIMLFEKKNKYMKFYNFFLRVFIFWNSHIIVYYQLSLSIVNVDVTILFC